MKLVLKIGILSKSNAIYGYLGFLRYPGGFMINKVVFSYDGKDYKYDDIFILIKKMKYNHTGDSCDWSVIEGSRNNHPVTIILFEESNGKSDWIHNFKFLPYPKLAYKGHENNLWYHRGFYEEYQSSRDYIIKAVEKSIAKTGCSDIIITGWSLGGGITPICAEDMYYHFDIHPTIICYEGPQPCASIKTRNYISRLLADDSVSFIYDSDIVPQVPPVPLCFKLKKTIVKLGKFSLFRVHKTVYYHQNVVDGINKYMTGNSK